MIPMLEDCVLDHIAIAVKNLEASVLNFEKLGLHFDSNREVVESQKVTTAFCPIDNNGKIELLEPTDSSSTIAKFIEKKGEGLHHLCFQVKDVIAKQSEMEKNGIKFIYEKPFLGAHNCLVNFIHPKSMSGVLVEISQKMKG